ASGAAGTTGAAGEMGTSTGAAGAPPPTAGAAGAPPSTTGAAGTQSPHEAGGEVIGHGCACATAPGEGSLAAFAGLIAIAAARRRRAAR
ncbi:MAG TPA: MYXO-CTERM sorting domain-containing protein, partial [Minicystis sp.]|nr:MYXO-CTERM sorting domain-containing protein [Minicystis sp.]